MSWSIRSAHWSLLSLTLLAGTACSQGAVGQKVGALEQRVDTLQKQVGELQASLTKANETIQRLEAAQKEAPKNDEAEQTPQEPEAPTVENAVIEVKKLLVHADQYGIPKIEFTITNRSDTYINEFAADVICYGSDGKFVGKGYVNAERLKPGKEIFRDASLFDMKGRVTEIASWKLVSRTVRLPYPGDNEMYFEANDEFTLSEAQ